MNAFHSTGRENIAGGTGHSLDIRYAGIDIFKVDDINKSHEVLAAEKVRRDEELLDRREAEDNEDELMKNYDRVLKLMPEKPDEGEMIRYLQAKPEAAMLKFVRIEFGQGGRKRIYRHAWNYPLPGIIKTCSYFWNSLPKEKGR